jgi:hypothetical protein
MIYGTHPSRWANRVEDEIITTVMELRKSIE